MRLEPQRGQSATNSDTPFLLIGPAVIHMTNPFGHVLIIRTWQYTGNLLIKSRLYESTLTGKAGHTENKAQCLVVASPCRQITYRIAGGRFPPEILFLHAMLSRDIHSLVLAARHIAST